jgi:hypothetical protein
MTNRASLLFALAILAAAQVASCQKKASFTPALVGDFFPLRPDSTWTYRVVDTSQNTTEILTDRALRKDQCRHTERRWRGGIGILRSRRHA